MSDSLEQLFNSTSVKDFVPLFQEAVKQSASPRSFLEAVVDYLPLRLYEHYYQDSAPHSFFGMIAALWASESLFSEETRWRPLAQQSWFATQERKRTPLEVGGLQARNEGDPEANWASFRGAAEEEDFQTAMEWARGFLADPEGLRFFRSRSLAYALEDSFLGGHKALNLKQTWRLAEALEWSGVEKILAPALHLLVVAPRDRSLFWKVQPNLASLGRLSENSGGLSRGAYEEVESLLLFSQGGEGALKALQHLTDSGSSLETAADCLLLAAAQALINSRPGEWVWPIRAFHMISLARQNRSDEHLRTLALAMGASLLQRASCRTSELDHNRPMIGPISELVPVEPLAVLRSVVSHTDPYAAAGATQAALSAGEALPEDLFEVFANLAAKNDGQVCQGHDLLFLHEMADCYKQTALEERDKLPLAAGFFLGRVRKEYELFGTYKD